MSNYYRCENCGTARATCVVRTESGLLDVCGDCASPARGLEWGDDR